MLNKLTKEMKTVKGIQEREMRDNYEGMACTHELNEIGGGKRGKQ